MSQEQKKARNKNGFNLIYPPPQHPPPLEVEAVVPLAPLMGYMMLVYPVRLLFVLSWA
jgi:hypothetical protein